MKNKKVYYRYNKLGSKEQIIKYIGHPEISILNEIIQTVINLVNNSPDKDIKDQIIGEHIFISEHAMAKKPIVEWTPEFKSGEYDPGTGAMDSPEGGFDMPKKTIKYKFSTELKKVGQEFPGKHNDTAAMCDVDEDGVEHEPQGSHVSKHQEPKDEHHTEVGHNWPDQPKNSGGSNEKFPGSRYGGAMGGVDENLHRIENFLAENNELQQLFNSYAQSAKILTLEGFQDVCDRYNMNVTVDEFLFEDLLDSNQQFVFHESKEGWKPVKASNVVVGLQNFFESVATSLSQKRLTESMLNSLWNKHAKNIKENMLPPKAKTGINTLRGKYPGFKPFGEASGVLNTNPDISKWNRKAGFKNDLKMADQPGPDDIKTHGDKNLLKFPTKNKIDTPIVKGTDKLSEGLNPLVKRNAQALYRHISKHLAEAKNSLRGDYKVSYSVIVKENSQVNKTKSQDDITEAILDAEEILQNHDPENVSMEANFSSMGGKTLFVKNIPLFTIQPHKPVATEGKTLFRFKRHAESFANKLVTEGKVCRIISHNWGSAVVK